MEARFGKMSSLDESDHSTRSQSSAATTTATNPSFFARELRTLRKTVWTAGSKYNILVSSLVGFLATFALLLVFRPFFVMRTAAKPSLEDASEYVNPQFINTHEPEPCADSDLSIGAVLLWSAMAAVATALLTYFTCRKSETPRGPRPDPRV